MRSRQTTDISKKWKTHYRGLKQHKCQGVTVCRYKDNALINKLKLTELVFCCPPLTVMAGYKIRIDKDGKASFLTLLVTATQLRAVQTDRFKMCGAKLPEDGVDVKDVQMKILERKRQ